MGSRQCQQAGLLPGRVAQRQRHDSLRGSRRSNSWMHLCILLLVRLLFVTLSECCWARNTTLTISGYTPIELATRRRPTDHSDLELMKPDQLSAVDLPRDATLQELKKMALQGEAPPPPKMREAMLCQRCCCCFVVCCFC